MSKRLKISVIVCWFFILIGILSIYNYTTLSLSSDKIHASQEQDFTFSGNYNGNISVMYFDEDSTLNTWNNTDSVTQIIPFNFTRHGYDYEYKVNRLDIRADVELGELQNFTIAKNTSQQLSLKPAFRIAQEFTAPENITKIEELKIYLTFNLTSINITSYYLDLFIYDEFLQNRLDWVWVYDKRKVVDEWITFHPNYNEFEPNKKYNIVFRFYHLDYPNSLYWDFQFDFWKAENYTNPSFNKGITRYYNNTSENEVFWTPFSNDTTIDMLCKFTYKEEIDWTEVGLKLNINDENIIPNFQESYTTLTYDIDHPLSEDINITITSKQMLAFLTLSVEIYYIYVINTNGTYNVGEESIEWIIEYYYENIPFGYPPPQFLFERDWDLIKLEDSEEQELRNIYFGPTSLYNESYYGITTFFGPVLEEGTYTGFFNSPNYCHSISAKVKSGNNFVIRPSVELGQIIKLEAEIIDPFNQRVSGGTGNIMLLSPSGDVIYNETGLTSVNGSLSSFEIAISSNFGKGMYEAVIFWTNGKEIAYYAVQIIVIAPVNIIFWVILSIIIAAASTPLALVARKYIRQRNWQKSLRNLFVFTKDGLSLYEYSFGIEIQDPGLISAMISALTNFVREATGSKEALKTIDQEDKKMILYHGNHTTITMMSDKDLPIIHKRVKKFSEIFEGEFDLKLKNWDGETTVFKDAEVIVNKCFPIDVERQIIHGVRGKLIEFRNILETMSESREIISLIREITDFISRYRAIVNKYYIDYYFEIIKIAEEKISAA
ncbi:MAG: hypothetical protein ACFE91_07840 [Promethearchaeota archaeon]